MGSYLSMKKTLNLQGGRKRQKRNAGSALERVPKKRAAQIFLYG